jgi:hypothetical protein
MEAVDGFRKEVVKSYDKLSPKSLKRGALNANPVKVAVIDDGVNPRLLNSRGIVKKGWPQPKFRRGTVKAYHKSAEGHGTKMANLIQSVCPYVHLYVAKLDKSSTDYDSMAQMAADVSSAHAAPLSRETNSRSSLTSFRLWTGHRAKAPISYP